MNVPLLETMRSITRRDITRSIETRTPRDNAHIVGAPFVDINVWGHATDPIGNNAYVAISSAIQKLRP